MNVPYLVIKTYSSLNRTAACTPLEPTGLRYLVYHRGFHLSKQANSENKLASLRKRMAVLAASYIPPVLKNSFLLRSFLIFARLRILLRVEYFTPGTQGAF